MTLLAGLLRPAAGARRAYSVFSKPGGGGYFSSSKAPKAVPPSSKTKKVDTSSNPNADNASPSSPTSKDDPSSLNPGVASHADTSSSPSSPPAFAALTAPSPFAPVHPHVSPKDLKLHQFFSLHRPLLTLGQVPATLFDSHASPFPPPPPAPAHGLGLGASPFADEALQPFAAGDADADAARQLARAMVVNRVGASLAWEETLRRLGLDDAAGRAEEVSLAEAEFDAYMDSTKRKKRKKMKKHK